MANKKKAAPKPKPEQATTVAETKLEDPKQEVTETEVERAARDAEKRTKTAISKTPMVPIWIDPVIGTDGEVLTYRLNGVTYHVKTKQVVEVPQALAEVIQDQARRKKISARVVEEYAKGLGKGLGELA